MSPDSKLKTMEDEAFLTFAKNKKIEASTTAYFTVD